MCTKEKSHLIRLESYKIEHTIPFNLQYDRLSAIDLIEFGAKFVHGCDGNAIYGVNDVAFPQRITKIRERSCKRCHKDALGLSKRYVLQNLIVDADCQNLKFGNQIPIRIDHFGKPEHVALLLNNRYGNLQLFAGAQDLQWDHRSIRVTIELQSQISNIVQRYAIHT